MQNCSFAKLKYLGCEKYSILDVLLCHAEYQMQSYSD